MEYRLNFLLSQDEHGWTGRCLEYHFVTEADTLPGLMYELQRTMVGHLVISQTQGIEPFAGLSRAPDPYWAQFREAMAVVRLREWPAQLQAPDMALPPHEVEEMRIAETVT
jgi:hypothetical protein